MVLPFSFVFAFQHDKYFPFSLFLLTGKIYFKFFFLYAFLFACDRC